MCPLSVLLLAAGPLGGAVGDVDAKRSRSSEQRASPFDHRWRRSPSVVHIPRYVAFDDRVTQPSTLRGTIKP